MTAPLPDPDAGLDPGPEPGELLVVLPALDEEAHIEGCVRSLMAPPDWMARTAIVVADGGSRDRTREIVDRLADEFPNLSWVDNPGRFQSAGVNAAVAEAAGPGHRILVRCDVHALYPEGYVRDVAALLRARGAASVVTVMDAIGEGAVQRASAAIVDTPVGSGGAAHRGGRRSGWVEHGHHAAFDLAWFRRIGGYDPSFTHNEDAEYDIRLAGAGGRIWLAADIRLRYVMRPTLRALARQYRNYGRGRARTILKHAIRPKARQMLPVLNAAALAAFALAGLAWAPALLGLAPYAALLAGASLWGAWRLRSAAGLLAGPALAVIHMGWAWGFLGQVARAAPGRPGDGRARGPAGIVHAPDRAPVEEE
jgi:succinoglycan biosynthesis protein ExoA